MSLRLTIERVDRVSLVRFPVTEATYLAEAKRGWFGQSRRVLAAAKESPGTFELWTAGAIFILRSELDD